MSDKAEFARIDSAEIFASGTWNGLAFTDDDLDRIVKAFDALELSGKVPLKLGHEGPDVRHDPTTQFAMGWVDKVWREGRKLMASLDVPEKVHELINQGFLKFVSVELLKNVKAMNREIPWVLDAVALLGSDPPAVGVLKELRTFASAPTQASLLGGERVTFARVDYRSTISAQGGKATMSDKDTPTLQELMDRILGMQNQLQVQSTENAELKTRLAQFTTIKTRLDTVLAENREKEIKAQRDRITALIEGAVKSDDILPAARERFMRTHRVDDDEAVMAITDEDVKEFVRENPNPRKKAPKKAAFAAISRPTDDVPAGLTVDKEGVMRVSAWFKEQGIKSPTSEDWLNGTKAVFSQLPEFAERYKANADAIYDNKA